MTDSNVIDVSAYLDNLRHERNVATIKHVMAQLGLIIGPTTWLGGFRAVLRASTSRHAYSATVLA